MTDLTKLTNRILARLLFQQGRALCDFNGAIGIAEDFRGPERDGGSGHYCEAPAAELGRHETGSTIQEVPARNTPPLARDGMGAGSEEGPTEPASAPGMGAVTLPIGDEAAE